MGNGKLVTVHLIGVLALCLMSSASWANNPKPKRGRAHEKKAFTFIELEDWCAATNSFLMPTIKRPLRIIYLTPPKQ